MYTQPLAYSLRLPEDHMAKLKIIAKENGRSVNKEIEMLVKHYIKNYENEYGVILIDEDR